jgi:hypothetical protein
MGTVTGDIDWAMDHTRLLGNCEIDRYPSTPNIPQKKSQDHLRLLALTDDYQLCHHGSLRRMMKEEHVNINRRIEQIELKRRIYI